MLSKTAIGELLQQARLKQNIQLDDIAASTRINRKFLAEIEEGIVPAVPVTYLRAFLRTFADQVGLDPAPILVDYFAEPPQPVPAEPPRLTFDDDKPLPTLKAPAQEPESQAKKQVKVLVVLSVVIVGTLAVLIMWLHNQQGRDAPQEVPFSDVVRENESPGRHAPAAADSASAIVVKPKVQRPDSLSLEVVASESVWVHVVIDSVTTREYLLAPKRKLVWKAKREFLVSLGNSAGVQLKLNGQNIGPIGKPSKPVKNVPVNWETWERTRGDRSKKEAG